jgi:hypothetical protein
LDVKTVIAAMPVVYEDCKDYFIDLKDDEKCLGDLGDIAKETASLISNVIKTIGDYDYAIEIYKSIVAIGGYFDAVGQDCF